MKWLHTMMRAGMSRPVLAVCVLLLALDGWLELRGLPARRCPLVQAQLASGGLDAEFNWLRVGLFRGVVLNDLSFVVMTPAGPLLVRSESAAIRLRLGALLRGQVIPDSLQLNGAQVRLLDELRQDLLLCRLDRVMLHLDVDDSMKLQLRGNFHGFELSGSAELANGRPWFEQQRGRDSGVPPRRQAQVLAGLKALAGWLARCDLGQGDARIDFSLSGDCLEPGSLAVRGSFSLSDAELDELLIDKLRGVFVLTAEHAILDQLLLLMGREERLQGEMRYDWQRGELSAALSGQMSPAGLVQVLGRDGREVPQWLMALPNLHFRGSLPPSRLDWRAMRPEVRGSFGQTSLQGIQVQGGRFVLAMTEGAVLLRDLHVEVDELAGEWLAGSGAWSYDKDQISGKIIGELQLQTRLRRLGLRVPDDIFSSGDHNLAFSLELQPSPLFWRQWRLSAQLSLPQARIIQREIDELRVKMRLDAGRLFFEDIALSLAGLPVDALQCRASADVLDFIDKGVAQVDFTAGLLAQGGNGGDWGPGLTIQGKAVYQREQGSLALSSAGTVYSDRLYRSYRGPLRIPAVDILALIYCSEQPVQFTLDMPPWIMAREPWRFGGKLHGEDGGFDTLAIRVADGDYEVTSRATTFSKLRATTTMGESIALDMRIQYQPFEFALSNIDVVGNPRLADPFIMHAYGREIYNQIWEHVRWDPAYPAHIEASSLVYSSGSDTDWRLTLSSRLTVANVVYHDAEIPALSVEVGLDLPSHIKIKPISVTVPDGTLRAECDIYLQGVPQCEFRILPSEATLDPKRLLLAIDPSWGNLLGDVTISDASRLDCEGSFFLSGESRLRVHGRLRSPRCAYALFAAEDVDAGWSLTADTLHWQVTDARYLGGHLATSGYYDISSKRGETLVLAKKMSLERFLTQLGLAEKLPASLPGVVNAETRVEFLRGWAGRPYHLEGTGHVAIREAELWQVPLLTQLGSLLEFSTFSWLTQRRLAGLGRISSLDADVEFVGQRVLIPSLSTDGTIIALNGSGEYRWDNDKLFFLVSGEALKEVSFLSMVLKPLTWAFHAELAGTRRQNEWKLRTALRKIFATD